ncbi:MAG: type II toxin-antitoxin system death-on-curing family toxin [Myxococcales bacterium]|nr:type II toxin-antitoxin system death-on-curing family toxin [Myxococcales bacterium]
MKLADVLFLEVEDVEQAHAVSLAAHGGQDGIRDRGLLESAVMAPRTGYYGSLAELAAVYAHGLVKNHPFLDGNKRTGLVVALVFLELNGRALTLGFEWAGHIERFAAGKLSRDELVALFAGEMGDPVPLS